MRCAVQVINIDSWSYLRVRNGPSLSNTVVGKKHNGDTFIADKQQTDGSNYKWYHIEGTSNWCCASTSGGIQYIKITQDLEKKVETKPAPQNNNASNANKNAVSSATTTTNQNTPPPQPVNTLGGVPKQIETTEIGDTQSFVIYNSGSYINNGKYDYSKYADYKTNYHEFDDAVNIIKDNLNIPSFYTKPEINKLTHENFNRYGIEYPDLYMRSTIPVIIFTRPDLNLFDDAGNLHSQLTNDPRVHYTLLKNSECGKLLTSKGYGNITHNFNPLLSNLAQNMEVQDDSIDLLETGETFTGYKMQYAKHNIKSITNGTFSIKFKETYDLAITDIHQIWVDYQSNVYRGIFKPKREHIWEKSLDYACNIYYFLLDQDGETILFWSKYFGCFPTNVPKSAFSGDIGSLVQYPELSVSYSYIYKEDLSPMSLIEFNHDAGDTSLGYKYLRSFDTQLGHSGKTWVGTPFVSSFTYNSGVQGDAKGFKFRWRDKGLL